MDTTGYFERIVKVKRPEAREEAWIQAVIDDPFVTEIQADQRVRRWGYIPQARKWLRVITEADAVHNAFFDNAKLRQWGRPPWN